MPNSAECIYLLNKKINMMDLPFSQACENNQHPIFEQLKNYLTTAENVLEIGAGTGQHAVYFANNLPDIHWHSADLSINHQHLSQRFKLSSLDNIYGPYELDLNQDWLSLLRPLTVDRPITSVFSANTLHIVAWPLVERFFESVAALLPTNGKLFVYGPFNYDGQFTSESNAEFDLWLKARDQQSGIRDIEAITELADNHALTLKKDTTMPANNRFLVFEKLQANK